MSLWGEEDSSTGSFSSHPTYDYAPESVRKPPKWPIIVQICVILISLVLFFVSPRDNYLTFSLLGYVLTPFIVFALLALQRAKDISARSLAFYDHALGRNYIRVASILSLGSFLLAIPIIWRLATEISQF